MKPIKLDTFWHIIHQCREQEPASNSSGEGVFAARANALREILVTMSPTEIAMFRARFDVLVDEAYSWDLWGAAYVLGGGCSDDGFIDFRFWLISLGRATFERALADPDSLADVKFGPGFEEDSFFEDFGYVAHEAYETLTNDEMPVAARDFPSEPSGVRWNEAGDELARRYPRLWTAQNQ